MVHTGYTQPEGRAILRPETIVAMQIDSARAGENSGYGLGWGTGNQFGYRIISHNGGMGGVCTFLWMIPGDGLVIVVLCNSSWKEPFIVSRIVGDIASVALPPFGQDLAKQRAERAAAAAEPTEETVPALPPRMRGSWQGTIWTHEGDIPLRLDIRKAEDMRAQIGDALWSLVNGVTVKEGYIGGKML